MAELQEPLEAETEFLPITTRAYLYLSGTPFKALATGEFIEEQILIGPIPTSSAQKMNLPLRTLVNGTLTTHFRKCDF